MSLAELATDPWIEVLARPPAGSPALFLDRDGTLIENVDYLADPAAVRLLPGAVGAVSRFRAAGFAVVLVTNQSGVARGLVTPEQYRAVTRRMLDLVGADMVDAVFACPWHPDGLGPWAAAHRWRKPQPGMLVDAAELLGLDLARSIMVGDSISDVQAGLAAGVGRVVHVASGHGLRDRAAVQALAQGEPRFEFAASLADIGPERSAA